MIWLLLSTLATYLTPGFFPDPSLAFYVMRGCLGAEFAVALWLGVRISTPVLVVIAAFEASSAVCGSLFVFVVPAREGLCDKGTGLPTTLLFLTGAVLAAVFTIRPNRNRRGD